MFHYPNPRFLMYVTVAQMLIGVVSVSLLCLGVAVCCEGKRVSEMKGINIWT